MDSKAVIYLLAGILLLVASVILLLSRKRGLPSGAVIYDDLLHDGTPIRPFFSEKYGLAGKPDLIIRRGNALIPMEVKSTPGAERPYPSHILQLAAYCLLIEETFGIRPEYGIIRCRDKEFEIPYDEQLRNRLLSVMDRMREEDPANEMPPVCTNRQKCRHCGFADACEKMRCMPQHTADAF